MNFRFPHIIFFVLFFLPVAVWGQGTYYNSLDTGSASFVTTLHNLINPHTKISYAQFDETNVVFVSRDTLTTKRVVTCVYSGENYIYTAPFAWTTFSREHTYCHSWMPTNPADSPERPEYSDQHHLFPTNQNSANGVRSNHPLGIVSNVTSSYLLAKYGSNSLGQTVYEPRNSHKGDAARALLYMAVCYNGVDGYDWTFNHLNTVILPPQSEAPQSVDLLIQWHNQDPPDQWEMDRNDYVFSKQGNRNPFIDHPEYVAKIDFNTLTKRVWGAVSLATEPTNYPTSLAAGTVTTTSIQLNWTKSAAGTQKPTGYLLLASTSASITAPTDGIVISDDTNLSDNSATVNIDSSLATYSFSGLSSGTTYYFKLIPYNGTGTSRNYKTDGVIPNTSTATITVVPATEPANFPTNFNQGTITASSVQLTWTKSLAGVQAPSGYLMIGSTSQSFTDPTDGIVYSDDSILADTYAVVNLDTSLSTYTFSGLTAATTYYFKIYPYNGTGNTRNYKTGGSTPFQFGLTSGSGASIPSVVVNEYMNGAVQSAEWVELLVLQDNLDMRGMKLQDYSSTGSVQSGSAVIFTTNTLWASVAKGTFIVVLGKGNTQTEDTNPSDKVIVVCDSNATYFSGGTGFNISGTADALEILTSGGTHIHSLSNGNKPGAIATLPSPTANYGSALVGGSVRFTGVTSAADFSSDAKTSNGATATQGAANDQSETAYIASILPVEIVSFTGNAVNGVVKLIWKTATEVNNYGFEIERRAIDNGQLKIDNWNKIGFVEGNGSSNSPKEYSFIDWTAQGSSAYRLKQIDRDGKFEYSSEVHVTVPSIPQQYSLMQNYPNPFNPSTTIRFTIAASEHVILTIYNALGQKIESVLNGELHAGPHEISYNASALSSGTYFYALTAGKFTATKSFVLMK